MGDHEKTVANRSGEARVGHEREHEAAPGEVGPNGQHSDYWVLSEDERAKGFVRPVRRSYVHTKCGGRTTMGVSIAETYARDPTFYGATMCCICGAHSPVAEFTWDGSNELVGS